LYQGEEIYLVEAACSRVECEGTLAKAAIVMLIGFDTLMGERCQQITG